MNREQGKPASTTWNTGHTNSHNDSSPGIATEPMGSLRPNARLGSSVVRLDETTVSDYINNTEKRGFLKRRRR